MARTSSGSSTTHSLESSRPGVAADRAERLVGDVEAALAEHDLIADGDQCAGQRPGLGVRGPQQVVRQPLGGLRPDPGQARERLDQARDGLDDGA